MTVVCFSLVTRSGHCLGHGNAIVTSTVCMYSVSVNALDKRLKTEEC